MPYFGNPHVGFGRMRLARGFQLQRISDMLVSLTYTALRMLQEACRRRATVTLCWQTLALNPRQKTRP